MSIKVSKHTISFLFLSAFLLLKVANAHSLSHLLEEEENWQCELCEMAFTFQENTPVVYTSGKEWVPKVTFSCEYQPVIAGYQEPLQHIASPHDVHNKPPPFGIL